MAARPKKVAVKERKAPVKQLTLTDKKNFMKALNQIACQVEVMQTQICDLQTLTKNSSFWLI